MPITMLLQRISLGDRMASEALYREAAERLRDIARRMMSKERATAGFAASDLMQEAYVRKKQAIEKQGLKDGQHFFAIMKKAMRETLVDRARAKTAAKRTQRDEMWGAPPAADVRLEDLARNMARLKQLDEKVYQIVRMRNDLGLTWEAIGERTGKPVWEARREYGFALRWLREHMG